MTLAWIDAEFADRLEELGLSQKSRPALVADLEFFTMPDGLGIQVRGTETPWVFRGRVAHDIVLHLKAGLDRRCTVEQLVGERRCISTPRRSSAPWPCFVSGD